MTRWVHWTLSKAKAKETKTGHADERKGARAENNRLLAITPGRVYKYQGVLDFHRTR